LNCRRALPEDAFGLLDVRGLCCASTHWAIRCRVVFCSFIRSSHLGRPRRPLKLLLKQDPCLLRRPHLAELLGTVANVAEGALRTLVTEALVPEEARLARPAAVTSAAEGRHGPVLELGDVRRELISYHIISYHNISYHIISYHSIV